MNMRPEIWNLIVTAVGSSQGHPAWLKDQLGMNWGTVSQLPPVDATRNGQHAIPTVEEGTVAKDYLDFLREQIALNPRGPDWQAILRSRLNALEPFVGKKLLRVTFHAKPHGAFLRMRPGTGDVIRLETF